MKRVFSVLKAIRFVNLIILLLAQVATAYFLAHAQVDQLVTNEMLFLLIGTGCIAAAGYIINDYYDIKIDLVNHPDTVVVGAALPRRQAIILHWSFNALGVGAGFLVGWEISLVNLVSAFLLWWYSNYLKRLLLVGNLVVGLLTGLSVLLVAFIYPTNVEHIAIFAFFAGGISLVREIIKDIEDQVGDKKFGCKTLPVVWGIRRTKTFLYGLIIAFSVSYLLLTYVYFRTSFLLFLSVLIPFLLLLMYRVFLADTKKDFNALSNLCKVIMVIGIVLMAFA